MSKQFLTEELFIKVVNDLSDFLPYLVLVGGWVPYLYAKYIWPNELDDQAIGEDIIPYRPQPVISTTDMDFGVIIRAYPGSESIADRVRKLGYGERHLSMDRLIPFVPIVKGKHENEKAEVEFITIQNPPKFIQEKLVGKAIRLNTVPHFNILLEAPITVALFSHKIQLPTESIFVFHKLLTFTERENQEKLKKDLYYCYYILRFSPNKDSIISQVQRLLKSKDEGKSVINNIKQYFQMKDDKGPVLIEQENGPDDYIDNVREDAYRRIIKLL